MNDGRWNNVDRGRVDNGTGPPRLMPVRQDRQERAPTERPDVIQQALPVPFYKVGWIVGKKGSYINQLCRKSGATITISDSESREFGTTWKYVMISGSGRDVDRAKKLIYIRLERYVAKTDVELAAAKEMNDADDLAALSAADQGSSPSSGTTLSPRGVGPPAVAPGLGLRQGQPVSGEKADVRGPPRL